MIMHWLRTVYVTTPLETTVKEDIERSNSRVLKRTEAEDMKTNIPTNERCGLTNKNMFKSDEVASKNILEGEQYHSRNSRLFVFCR